MLIITIIKCSHCFASTVYSTLSSLVRVSRSVSQARRFSVELIKLGLISLSNIGYLHCVHKSRYGSFWYFVHFSQYHQQSFPVSSAVDQSLPPASSSDWISLLLGLNKIFISFLCFFKNQMELQKSSLRAL